MEIDTTVFTKLAIATDDMLLEDKTPSGIDANDYLIYNSVAGILYYDADGWDTGLTKVKLVAIKGDRGSRSTYHQG